MWLYSTQPERVIRYLCLALDKTQSQIFAISIWTSSKISTFFIISIRYNRKSS